MPCGPCDLIALELARRGAVVEVSVTPTRDGWFEARYSYRSSIGGVVDDLEALFREFTQAFTTPWAFEKWIRVRHPGLMAEWARAMAGSPIAQVLQKILYEHLATGLSGKYLVFDKEPPRTFYVFRGPPGRLSGDLFNVAEVLGIVKPLELGPVERAVYNAVRHLSKEDSAVIIGLWAGRPISGDPLQSFIEELSRRVGKPIILRGELLYAVEGA